VRAPPDECGHPGALRAWCAGAGLAPEQGAEARAGRFRALPVQHSRDRRVSALAKWRMVGVEVEQVSYRVLIRVPCAGSRRGTSVRVMPLGAAGVSRFPTIPLVGGCVCPGPALSPQCWSGPLLGGYCAGCGLAAFGPGHGESGEGFEQSGHRQDGVHHW